MKRAPRAHKNNPGPSAPVDTAGFPLAAGAAGAGTQERLGKPAPAERSRGSGSWAQGSGRRRGQSPLPAPLHGAQRETQGRAGPRAGEGGCGRLNAGIQQTEFAWSFWRDSAILPVC